jgi:Cytochrome c7 and related cytochrome c/Class III cytochrome C family
MKRLAMQAGMFALIVVCVHGNGRRGVMQDAQGQPASPAGAPKQPIDFSHKVHAGAAKLPCKMCHPNPDPGETMTIVGADACMQCHSAIKADSPEIKKLAEYAKSSSPVPWAPVYELPSFVKFSHRVHLQAGDTCQECHGAVRERDRLYREASLTMGACMNCHRLKKATLDCAVCHDLPG